MKKEVSGKAYTTVIMEIEIDDSELEGLAQEEINELFVEKAYDSFGGIDSFLGNGGADKLIGVTGINESIYGDGEVDFDEVENVED
ncbi:hypothetical protein CIL05_07260 [Virgibacillus profundi]|uniref:Uncharacterized protein n=1 Tax=Virgibacillus profundi TaxID=2024555 RepID=A0A2A2IEU5_9BACI|nr:hypothetical protein [Virgibacillus profundi]PAV30259.1 hypothetical protein CIL05_07260 [Virgibacillus profundi]PXY54431.1 hypothetical protein CIT14_07345 [Virgibacillus profundi]